MAEMRVAPVEEMILVGVAQRFQQVFGCPCIVNNTYEKMQAIKQLFDGKPVRYPYATISVKAVYPNTDSYATNYIARRGLQAVVFDSNNAAYTVRLLPTNFDLEIEYHADQFDLAQNRSVLAFAKSWLFARRLGYMKFNLEYGRLVLGISADLIPTLQLPSRENLAENETVYKVGGAMTVKGYMSQAEMGMIGIVQETAITESLDLPNKPITIETSTPVVWAIPSGLGNQRKRS